MTLVKSQTLGIYFEDTPEGLLVTQNGSLTDLAAFSFFAPSNPPDFTLVSLSVTSTHQLLVPTDETQSSNSLDEIQRRAMTESNVELSNPVITGTLYYVTLGPNLINFDSNYTQGDMVDGSMLFAGKTLAGEGFISGASSYAVVDGGNGNQTILFQVAEIPTMAPSPAPSSVPSSTPSLSSAPSVEPSVEPSVSPAPSGTPSAMPDDDSDCPCRRWRFFCRILNGCLFGYSG